MAELIEMPFAKDFGGTRNQVLDGGQDLPMARGNFEGKRGVPIVKYRDTLQSSLQRRLNRLRCRLGCGLGWAKGIALDGSPQVLRDVLMATSFGMQFAITGFLAFNGL